MSTIQRSDIRVNGQRSISGPDGAWHRAGLDPRGNAEEFGTGPRCACEGRLVWRGRWRCESCGNGVAYRAPGSGSLRALEGAAPPAEAGEFFRSLSVNNCDTSEERAKWLEKMDWLTSPVRWRQAVRMQARGVGAGGVVGPWHRTRARAQARRFERLRECGTETGLHWVDGDTGKSFPHVTRCGLWRLCSKCRQRRQSRLTESVRAQRLLALYAYRRERHQRYRGSEGRWGERLVTLTVPHSGDVARDVETIVRAWRAIEAPWRRHLKERGCVEKQAYLRAIETTAGRHREGHAHLHIWLVGPYIDHAMLRAWWGAALEREGYVVPRRPLEQVLGRSGDRARVGQWLARYASTGVPWPVVDVRRGSDRAAYVVKSAMATYVVKGTRVERQDPELAARTYAALEGRRVVQWASGWAPQRARSGRWHLRRLAKSTNDTVFPAIHYIASCDTTRMSDTDSVTERMVEARGHGEMNGTS